MGGSPGRIAGGTGTGDGTGTLGRSKSHKALGRNKSERVESGRNERGNAFRNPKGAQGEKPRTMDCHPGINAKYGRQEFWNPCSLIYPERYNSVTSLRINFNSQAATAGHFFNS